MMSRKTKKWLWILVALLCAVGGLAWLLKGTLGIDLIVPFGAFGWLVETLAGVSGIALALKYFWKR